MYWHFINMKKILLLASILITAGESEIKCWCDAGTCNGTFWANNDSQSVRVFEGGSPVDLFISTPAGIVFNTTDVKVFILFIL